MTDVDEGMLVIGLGKGCSATDSLALVVTRKLRELQLPGVRVIDPSCDQQELADALQDCGVACIVAPICSGIEPGHIHRVDLSTESIPAGLRCDCASYTNAAVEAIKLAAGSGANPPRLILCGIEGTSSAVDGVPSPSVRETVNRVVACLLGELTGYDPGVRLPNGDICDGSHPIR